jgi:hypothetical protein
VRVDQGSRGGGTFFVGAIQSGETVRAAVAEIFQSPDIGPKEYRDMSTVIQDRDALRALEIIIRARIEQKLGKSVGP